MNFKNFYKIVMLLFMVTIAISCEDKGSGEAPILVVSTKEATFEPEGGTSTFTIEANSKWTIENEALWLQIDKAAGDAGTTTVTLTTLSNDSGVTRPVKIRVIANNGQARVIYILQAPNLYPNYNLSPKPADATGMSSTAVELAAKMTMGVNIGNTMEAWRKNGDVIVSDETAWGNPKVTESYIQFLKATGFNAVRIPCSWNQGNLSDASKMKIDPVWLNRVKEVVGWCVANDMYVMLNIHWDGGWLESKELSDGTQTHNFDPSSSRKNVVNAIQKALWEQIATAMRDFDEHLFFAGSNEPAADNAQEMAILNSYHESFIKAVRSTGGRNTYRVLVVQGPGTNASKTYDLMTIPSDPTPNRMMVEVHEYSPSQFCFVDEEVLGTWKVPVFYWGAGNHSTIEPERNATYGEEDEIADSFNKLKEKFISKGIPVVLGEYAAMRRNTSNNAKFIPLDTAKHNKSVDDWTTFVTKQCHTNGVVPFYWEIGNILNRNNNTIKDQAMIDAMKAGLN
ncbi:MAG: cellulase family glycosylhydrolase [Flavobacterium sp.]|uniref:cellulase family glycosylhydrolase n=1 Tax=Flavobacterium sp. TaxID=239 RepID=UPI002601AE1B|nr:cellulase family glycosylhydrolase [Flavobacterium sp.]MDD5149817.1 cellulase family glycosylhydrolase [Flavobacterium sp.]